MKQNEVMAFLKEINYVFNNNENVTSKHIYSLLIYYQTERKEISHLFDNWINYYQNKDNISVFVDPNWNYFCQFVNAHETGCKMIKLYLPLKENYLENGVKIIFDFLCREGIHHRSKIGSYLRNDNLVIRVNSLVDAKKIINFVENNSYIHRGLLKTNPFVFNYHGVGLALDGNYSYNDELSKILFNYFTERRKFGHYDSPAIAEFGNYLLFTIRKIKDHNLLMIYRLIHSNITNSEFNFNDFSDLTDVYQQNFDTMARALIKTKMKYGRRQMMLALTEMLNGEFGYITNDNGERERVLKYLSKDQVKSMINRVCGYNRDRKVEKETLIQTLLKIEEFEISLSGKVYLDALEFGVKETMNLYNYSIIHVRKLLNLFMTTRDYNLFTSNNGARQRVEETFRNCDNLLRVLRVSLKLDDSCLIPEAIEEFINQKILNEGIKKK